VDSPIDIPTASALTVGDHDNPFAVLGQHSLSEGGRVICALVPDASDVGAVTPETGDLICRLERVAGDVFCGTVPDKDEHFPYRLRAGRGDETWEIDDPYRYGPVLGELDEYLIAEGTHQRMFDSLGAHVMHHEGTEGVHFAVWAPSARRVSVVGDFNHWDGRRHVMRRRGSTGVWEIFVPGLAEGTIYKFEIKSSDGALLPLKADPLGFGAEHPPRSASIVRDLRGYPWNDQGWMDHRSKNNAVGAPISIYEVHLGSWRRVWEAGDRSLSYPELAEQLVPYVRDMGFTHIELLPISEHPFDGSWGYQPVGLYAPTIRHGTPNEFRQFVNACHEAELGVLLDWVPGHFPSDSFGLAQFDGTALYEHQDPREGFHQDWNTLIFNYGRREVRNYLIANALYWLGEHHLDGIRVDAVASMLYRDYSRKDGEWIPNVHGGNENLEAVAFLRRLNEAAYREIPGIMTAAEESTSWPGVSHPTFSGGLGFGYKWNMGWMHDTLNYMKEEPIHRRHHHSKMTFGLSYAFSENFILPLSHDEVVHGKGSLLSRMPGNSSDQFANLRAYYGFMWTHPGKKLLFMGGEFGQAAEWNHNSSLDWHLLEDPRHKGVQRLLKDLNDLYRTMPALYQRDCSAEGFGWVEANAANESVFAFVRYGDDNTAPVLVICNMTPVRRDDWRVGVPTAGQWRERLNTDAQVYGGTGAVAPQLLNSSGTRHGHWENSISAVLPPLSTLIFEAMSLPGDATSG